LKTSTAHWLTTGGKEIYVRSIWEGRYAKYLEWQKKMGYIEEWWHEPHTFWFEGIKRGCVSYKPDFLVKSTSQGHHWVEVKGYYDKKSVTKISRFGRYFPGERLDLVDSKWFRRNNAKMKIIIPDW